MPATRILGRRWAYRDKNYSRRRIDTNVAWRHKSHLVVFGHQDPDIGKVLTDAPTINRISILILLQFVAARQGGDDPCLGSCQASAGDVTAAFPQRKANLQTTLHAPATHGRGGVGGRRSVSPRQRYIRPCGFATILVAGTEEHPSGAQGGP